MPDFIVILDFEGGGTGGGGTGGSCTGGWVLNVVHLMISNSLVWHKSCRNATDNQKVLRARKKHEDSVSPVKTRHMITGDRFTIQSVSSSSTFSCDPVTLHAISMVRRAT